MAELPSEPTRNESDHKPAHTVVTPARCISHDSILGIIRRNSKFPLFVPLWRWTDVHTSLLGVQFTELPRCDAPFPVHQPSLPPSKGHMKPSGTIKTLSDALTGILSQDIAYPVQTAMQTIMVTLWPDCFCSSRIVPKLSMKFGDKVYQDKAIPQILWTRRGRSQVSPRNTESSFPSTQAQDSHTQMQSQSLALLPHISPGLPIICYVDMAELASRRKEMIQVVPGPKGQPNEPVDRLRLLHCRSITPENPDQDAYIAGIMLAIAQKHFTPNPQLLAVSKNELSAKDATPCVYSRVRLMTHDREKSDFVIYTGYVTYALLERFRRPRRVPIAYVDNSIGMTIDYVRVPIWPILGLRERLGRALGEDIVGVFDQEAMETWEEKGSLRPGGKRKRDATRSDAGPRLVDGEKRQRDG